MNNNPLIFTDYYKVEHHLMMPKGTIRIYSNGTPRRSRMPGVNQVVVFGLQYFIIEYLMHRFNRDFFSVPLDMILEEYAEAIHVDPAHIIELHQLGYLPIEIKALPEGSLCPIGVPMFTITNTHEDFSWLTNYLETLMSCVVWQPFTSATIAHEYRKLLNRFALETTGTTDGVQWQGHDFSMRGMSSPESAIASGMGHLLSFTGTDTIPAIYGLKKYYKGTGLIGASVPATEHSIQCMHHDFDTHSEDRYIDHLLNQYPEGFISMVSDGFNLWDVLTKTLPKFKDRIMARDGRLVIRPDSGDPVDIICGKLNDVTVVPEDGDLKGWAEDTILEYVGEQTPHGKSGVSSQTLRFKQGEKYYDITIDNISWNRYDKQYYYIDMWEEANLVIKEVEVELQPSDKGVIELLWDLFGGTIVKGNDGNEYKLLDSHIGAIYGDSITLDRARAICEKLKAKGFATTNVVLGIGSFTYQYNTRDTFGFAMKATYGEVAHDDPKEGGAMHPWLEPRVIYKDPITDDGTKKSAKGLLYVDRNTGDGAYILTDNVDWETEKKGALVTVFKDGKLVKETTLEEIRLRLSSLQ